ncbi:uncharacterized protein LOC116031777 [Ipomoea triloba]|uniref:uncharacterized protein LOC116031777 n=1 Tax=Ipomoea triloba TaxID=35885 RepID=UPI00125D4601|nr:uncharacterized protein LOC116031777 [Ipomoea triloba]XP_031129944.1 uncharacterized protein LOC116031777 [Ipomoea triloba]
MGFSMGVNMLLLMAMVATNILSLYHLTTHVHSTPSPPPPLPHHLIQHLHTIRAAINRLTRLNPPSSPAAPSDLLLFARIFPVATSCKDHPELLHKYMNYTPFALCPPDSSLAESLILRGCHPLPRRRCFSRTSPAAATSLPNNPFSPIPENAVIWGDYNCSSFNCFKGFDMKVEKSRFLASKSDLDLSIPQILQIGKSGKNVIRLAMDIGGGSGTFAAQMKLQNVTVITTTMNLGAPHNEAAALRGVVPLHLPLQQRLPVFDGVVDLVRCGHGVNRWVPVVVMEFLLFDMDRVLRGGGYLWLDHFFSKRGDLERVYQPMVSKLGYKKVKWVVANKNDSSGVKNGEVYLTALLQKPISR